MPLMSTPNMLAALPFDIKSTLLQAITEQNGLGDFQKVAMLTKAFEPLSKATGNTDTSINNHDHFVLTALQKHISSKHTDKALQVARHFILENHEKGQASGIITADKLAGGLEFYRTELQTRIQPEGKLDCIYHPGVVYKYAKFYYTYIECLARVLHAIHDIRNEDDEIFQDGDEPIEEKLIALPHWIDAVYFYVQHGMHFEGVEKHIEEEYTKVENENFGNEARTVHTPRDSILAFFNIRNLLDFIRLDHLEASEWFAKQSSLFGTLKSGVAKRALNGQHKLFLLDLLQAPFSGWKILGCIIRAWGEDSGPSNVRSFKQICPESNLPLQHRLVKEGCEVMLEAWEEARVDFDYLECGWNTKWVLRELRPILEPKIREFDEMKAEEYRELDAAEMVLEQRLVDMFRLAMDDLDLDLDDMELDEEAESDVEF